MEPYLQANRALWNKKTAVHVDSAFYNMEAFLEGQSSLQEIELSLLGDLSGKSLLHLQCHFGQDTLSLARMGARVTGVDLSDAAIDQARRLAKQLQLEADFVCCNVLEADKHVSGSFDVVFTSYGTIGWLPEVRTWAKVIAHFLKPGGRFIFVEFHPVIWMFDPGFSKVEYAYFNKEAIVEISESTYADRNAEINLEAHNWNHSLADVLGGLVKAGLTITDFQEYDFSPYSLFPNEVKHGSRYYIESLEGKLPMVFSVVAQKK